MEPLVRLDVDGGVATVTLDSPHNRNALSTRLRSQLARHLASAGQDRDVRVVVLTHTGAVFCSGMDLAEAAQQGQGDQGVLGFAALLETVWAFPKPVIARLAGPARAGGVGLVAACDIAVAVDTVSFAFTEVRLGLVPAVISAVVVPRLQSRAAHELFLTGETFDASRAVAVGLLSRAVPAGRLDAEVRRYTDVLALAGPQAFAATKRLLRERWAPALAADLERLSALSAQHFASTEGREGLAAFREKRRPHW